MSWSLGNYWYLLLLLLLPLLASFLIRFLRWRKKKREIFASSQFHDDLFDKSSGFTKFFPALYLLGTLFLIFSIIDLLNGSEEVKTNQKLNNVIFMLDVSNSMNAEDIDPSRLTEAKNLMIRTMQKMKNDKVGIVIFAGQATSIMPLTTDYNSAETYISGIETNSMQIQGTDFLKGMQAAVAKFKNVSKGSRKVILLSDGEDNEGNDNAAIRLANKEGVSVTSVGIGSDEGAPVPEYVFGQLMGYKTDVNGGTVISKRQTEALKKMAESTGGTYIDGNNINEAPDRILDAVNRKSTGAETLVKSQNANHYYQYFLAVSILLFFLIYIFNPKRDFNV
ncbi:VWA domain-containing protein [Chryseobacterium indologenes]|uniref:VWA domain-containing protein n=1 Tax=Chryseobacterium indologenes TaxID=253 RepID=A0A3G5Z0F3_CHRID|nr:MULTISPECIES: VWA domain-containing protein [Chryseobacterium]ATN06070.1 VWA domain-containing protein [Chryseobacterium indologenes]AYY85169.1 VWA domain-containing protein [Chryseobacterium indologenes]AZB17947.1 VWA domain-containing protein [Chryseobacterium indologenes]QIX82063.1 VWA domain-containing protein [Chryseobacterium indologenes]QPQ52235.1 VWA domain-containing protein [Chryseobacterium indologenes]